MRHASRQSNKRAVVEIQFNWIFILIVGGVLLFFFINLSMRQKELSARRVSVDLLQDMELVIAGQSVSVGRSNVLEIPPIILEFTCDAYLIEQNARQLGEYLIFAPPEIRGPKMITWTQDWRIPFRVANFVYLTSSRNKYYLVPEGGMEQTAQAMVEALPPELDVTIVQDITSLVPENNPEIRFVFLTHSTALPPFPSRFRNAEILSALQIVYGDDDEHPLLKFFEAKGNQWQYTGEIQSLGRAALYGALYTPSVEHYRCNIEKAIRRLHTVSAVYAARARLLHDSVRTTCQPFLTGVENDLLPMQEADINNLGQLFAALSSSIETLERRNEAAIIKSCPTVY